MIAETKNWIINYREIDGSVGTLNATTEISASGFFAYGNGKAGALIINEYPTVDDLRYNTSKDLHMAMIKDYFGSNLIKATERR